MTPRRLIFCLIVVVGVITPAIFLFVQDSAPAFAGVNAPYKAMPPWQQYLAVASAFVIKPLYMALALFAIWLLRRQKSPDLVALRWCCLFFSIGETFCAANYLGFGERSYLMEYLHSLGMTLALVSAVYAAAELADVRIIHFSKAEGCRLGALCGGCMQGRSASNCGVRRMLRLGLPFLILIAAMPLTGSYHPDRYFSEIVGTRYVYMHDWPHQQYEMRFLPIAAMALLALAWLTAGRERHPLPNTRLLVAGGVGAMGFSFFRWMLLSAFAQDQIWFVVWEELTELAAILALLALLHTFKLRISSRPNPASEQGSIEDCQ